MSESELLLTSQSNSVRKLYRKRWLVALVVGLQIMIVRFSMNSIGIVNDVYVEYFNISYIAVDWFSIIQFAGEVLGNLVAALSLYYKRLGVRRLSITTAAFIILTIISMFTASLLPFLYPLIYIGQFLLGFSLAILMIIVVQIANDWFPENEFGKAFTVISISTATASILAFLVPSNVLKQPSVVNESYANVNFSVHAQFTENANKKTFLIYYGTLGVVAFVISGLVLMVVEDKPPQPPSKAQEQLREELLNNPSTELKIKTFLNESKHILKSDVFLVTSVIFLIRHVVNSDHIIFLSEILRPINSQSRFKFTPNVLSGYILISYDSAVLVGSFISPYVFDRFKKHILQLSLSIFFMIAFMIGLVLGAYYEHVPVIWTFDVLLGFAYIFASIPLNDISLQHLHPINSGLISALQAMVGYVGAIAVIQTSRFILDYGGGISMLIFVSLLLLVALFVCVFLKPNFTRLQINS